MSFLFHILSRAVLEERYHVPPYRLFSAGVNFPKSFKCCYVMCVLDPHHCLDLKSSEVDLTGRKYIEIMTCTTLTLCISEWCLNAMTCIDLVVK